MKKASFILFLIAFMACMSCSKSSDPKEKVIEQVQNLVDKASNLSDEEFEKEIQLLQVLIEETLLPEQIKIIEELIKKEDYTSTFGLYEDVKSEFRKNNQEFLIVYQQLEEKLNSNQRKRLNEMDSNLAKQMKEEAKKYLKI